MKKTFDWLRERANKRKLFQTKILHILHNSDEKWTKMVYLQQWRYQIYKKQQCSQIIDNAKNVFNNIVLV